MGRQRPRTRIPAAAVSVERSSGSAASRSASSRLRLRQARRWRREGEIAGALAAGSPASPVATWRGTWHSCAPRRRWRWPRRWLLRDEAAAFLFVINPLSFISIPQVNGRTYSLDSVGAGSSQGGRSEGEERAQGAAAPVLVRRGELVAGRRGKEGTDGGAAGAPRRQGWALAPATQHPSSRASTTAVAVSLADKGSRRRGNVGKRRRSARGGSNRHPVQPLTPSVDATAQIK